MNMTTFDTNPNDQYQTDLISNIEENNSHVFVLDQTSDLDSKPEDEDDYIYDKYTDIIDYDDYNRVLDYYEFINMEDTYALFNLDEISKVSLDEFYNQIWKVPEVAKLIDVKADVEMSLNRSTNIDSLFFDYLFKAVFHSTTKYALHNKVSLFRFSGAQNIPIWINDDSCSSLCESTPHSIDTFELALYRLKPSKIIYLESQSHSFTTYSDLVFGFGVYLFDEHDNLISKMVYKFFDGSVAPENAYRLNAPITFKELQNRSRPFF